MSTIKKQKKYDKIEDLSKSEIKNILSKMGMSLDRTNRPKSYYVDLYNTAKKAKHKVTRDDTSFAFDENKSTSRKRRRSLKKPIFQNQYSMHKIEEIEEEDGSSIKKPKMNKKSGNKINNVIINNTLNEDIIKNKIYGLVRPKITDIALNRKLFEDKDNLFHHQSRVIDSMNTMKNENLPDNNEIIEENAKNIKIKVEKYSNSDSSSQNSNINKKKEINKETQLNLSAYKIKEDSSEFKNINDNFDKHEIKEIIKNKFSNWQDVNEEQNESNIQKYQTIKTIIKTEGKKDKKIKTVTFGSTLIYPPQSEDIEVNEEEPSPLQENEDMSKFTDSHNQNNDEEEEQIYKQKMEQLMNSIPSLDKYLKEQNSDKKVPIEINKQKEMNENKFLPIIENEEEETNQLNIEKERINESSNNEESNQKFNIITSTRINEEEDDNNLNELNSNTLIYQKYQVKNPIVEKSEESNQDEENEILQNVISEEKTEKITDNAQINEKPQTQEQINNNTNTEEQKQDISFKYDNIDENQNINLQQYKMKSNRIHINEKNNSKNIDIIQKDEAEQHENKITNNQNNIIVSTINQENEEAQNKEQKPKITNFYIKSIKTHTIPNIEKEKNLENIDKEKPISYISNNDNKNNKDKIFKLEDIIQTKPSDNLETINKIFEYKKYKPKDFHIESKIKSDNKENRSFKDECESQEKITEKDFQENEIINIDQYSRDIEIEDEKSKELIEYNISDDNKNQKNNDFSNKESISEKEENQGELIDYGDENEENLIDYQDDQYNKDLIDYQSDEQNNDKEELINYENYEKENKDLIDYQDNQNNKEELIEYGNDDNNLIDYGDEEGDNERGDKNYYSQNQKMEIDDEEEYNRTNITQNENDNNIIRSKDYQKRYINANVNNKSYQPYSENLKQAYNSTTGNNQRKYNSTTQNYSKYHPSNNQSTTDIDNTNITNRRTMIPLEKSIQDTTIEILPSTNINNIDIPRQQNESEEEPSWEYIFPPGKQPSNERVIVTSVLIALITIAFIFTFNNPQIISSLYHSASSDPRTRLEIVLGLFILVLLIMGYKIRATKQHYIQIATNDYHYLKNILHNKAINGDYNGVVMETFISDISTSHNLSLHEYTISVLPYLRELIFKDRFIIESTVYIANESKVLWREI